MIIRLDFTQPTGGENIVLLSGSWRLRPFGDACTTISQLVDQAWYVIGGRRTGPATLQVASDYPISEASATGCVVITRVS